jgi:hypothetical protein
MMKNLAFIPLLAPTLSFAATFSHNDAILRLAVIEYQTNADIVIVNGFESAGTCPLSTEGLVIAAFRAGTSGDRSYSMALAAKMAGKKVRLSVDDSSKNEAGQCYVRYIEIKE